MGRLNTPVDTARVDWAVGRTPTLRQGHMVCVRVRTGWGYQGEAGLPIVDPNVGAHGGRRLGTADGLVSPRTRTTTASTTAGIF